MISPYLIIYNRKCEKHLAWTQLHQRMPFSKACKLNAISNNPPEVMAPIHHIITPWHQPPNLMVADSNPVLVRQLQMCPWSKANKKRAEGCGLRKNNIHCLVAFLITAMVDISYIWFIEGYTAMERQLDIRGVYRTMKFIDGTWRGHLDIHNFFVKGEIWTFSSNQQNPFAIVSHKSQTGHIHTLPETNSESTWVWKTEG